MWSTPALTSLALAGALLVPVVAGQSAGAAPRPTIAPPTVVAAATAKPAAKHVVRPVLHRPTAPTAMVPGAGTVSWRHQGKQLTLSPTGFAGGRAVAVPAGHRTLKPTVIKASAPAPSSPVPVVRAPDWNLQLSDTLGNSAAASVAYLPSASPPVDVVFGGFGRIGRSLQAWNSTTLWNGTSWTTYTGSTAPTARGGAMMAYDPALGKAVLFGGWNGSSFYSDTWTFDGTSWTQLSPSSSPGPLAFGSMTYDATLGKLVLFGGASTAGAAPAFRLMGGNPTGTPTLSNATWTFDGTSWVQLSSIGAPAARMSTALGYDQDAGNDVLFGGYGASGTLADSWQFTGTGWTQLTPVNAPVGVSDATMAYDGTLHSLVLFGGQTATGSLTNTTSLWDSGHQSWQWASDDVAAASRIDSSLVPAATNGQLLLYGGKTSTDYTSSVFLYDWGKRGSSTGDQTDQTTLSDRASLAVDVGSGNAYLRQDGLDVAGTGVNLETFAQYNSQVSGGFTDSVWPMTLHYGPHGSMEIDGVGGRDDNMPFYADGSGGFTSPAGVNASLQYVSASTGYELIINAPSQQIYWFSAPADDGSGNPGVITAITDHSGNTISISGNTSTGNVTVVDTHGRTVTRTVSGGTATWTLPDGRTWSESAISGGWQTLTDVDGATVQLGYGGPNGALSNIIDAAGNQLQLSYDSFQRVTTITRLATGAKTSYVWNNAGSVVAGADLQVQRTDPAGNVAVDTNAYDGQTLATADPTGSTSTATYNGNLAPVTQTDALGNTATATYAAGDPTVQTAATAPATASGQTPATTSATYNTPSTVLGYQGLPSSTTDSQGDCTAKVYDAAGLPTDVYAGQAAPCDGLTGGVHTATRYQGDPGVPSCGAPVGQVCSKVDGDGAVTSYSYDSAGNLSSVTPPAPLQAISYTYDGSSRPATVTDASGVRTMIYDNADRVLQIRYGGATSCVPSAGTCISYGYDANGNRTQQIDASGTTSWSYDSANRLVKEIPPNAPLNSCSTPNDSGIVYTYDDAGNLVAMCSASGTTNYGYDRAGKLLTIGSPIAQLGVRSYGSTPGGTALTLPSAVRAGDLILVQVADPSTLTTPTGYSLVGTAGTGWTQQFVYAKTATASDTSVTLPSGGNSVLIAAYRGVASSSPIEAISTGEQDSWANSLTVSGVTTTAASDRLLLFGAVHNGASYTADGGLTVDDDYSSSGFDHTFLAGQALTAAGSAGNRTITSSMAAFSGVLLALKPADTTSVPTTHTYDADGNALTTRYPGGTTQHMTYNGSGRLSSIDAVDGTGATLFDYQVSWAHGVNDRNQRQSVTETVSGRTTAYSYDRLGRLTEAQDTAGGTEDYRYSYDGAGNIVQQVANGVTTSAAVNAADELCWTVTAASTNGCASPPSGATSYSYDGNGNLTGNTASFSATENALDQTTDMGTGGRLSLSMAYSGADQTVRTEAGPHTFVNAQDRVLTDTSGSTVASYTTEPQGMLVSQQLGSATYYYLYDAMSNVVGLVDGSGTRQATYRYTPYGVTLTSTGSAAGTNPYRFAGGYWDNTGLYHFGARYYDPALGRWTQPDPSAQDPGYVYAGDDPINSADPSGLTNNANGAACHWWGCDFRMSNYNARVLADRLNEGAGKATVCAAIAAFTTWAFGVGALVALICGVIAGVAWYYASRIQELVDRYGRGIFFRVHWWGDVSVNHQ